MSRRSFTEVEKVGVRAPVQPWPPSPILCDSSLQAQAFSSFLSWPLVSPFLSGAFYLDLCPSNIILWDRSYFCQAVTSARQLEALNYQVLWAPAIQDAPGTTMPPEVPQCWS